MFKKIIFALVVLVAAVFGVLSFFETPPPPSQGGRFVVIGTGGETGVYFPVGTAICSYVNARAAEAGLRCTARPTAGSVYNIEALRRGEIEFAIVQSDWQHYATTGIGAPQPMPVFSDLRAVMSLHSEVLTVVVRDDAKIRTLSDLKDKRVNLGLVGSGQRESIRLIFESMGQDVERLVIPTSFGPDEQARALCEGSSDALVYIAGHPNDAIRNATDSCQTNILSIDGELVERFLRQNPYYAAATIPANTYRNQRRAVRSVGLLATLVTTSRQSDETVFQITKAVYDNFELLRKAHPALAALDAKDMASAGLTAPIHRGAQRYLRSQTSAQP